MIRFVRGNIFESQAEALVNTVNCVGVMGKGIAHQFKRAFPAMFEDYAAKCRAGKVKLGEVTFFRESTRIIINFPTKGHWKSKSRIEDIATGLQSLRALIEREKIRSIALPPLGCGNGGLPWPAVKQVILSELSEIGSVDIEVYEPAGHFESRVAREPKVSLGHFVLAGLRAGLEAPTRLNIQKAAYFFNVFSGTDYFRFTEYKYGPYCIGIEPMFNTIRDYLAYTKMDVNKMLTDGIGRRLAGSDADRLSTWTPVINTVSEFCNRNSSNLEALATAHAVIAKHEPAKIDEIVEHFLSWSPEKSERFTPTDVHAAIKTLETQGLITRTLLGLELASNTPAQRSRQNWESRQPEDDSHPPSHQKQPILKPSKPTNQPTNQGENTTQNTETTQTTITIPSNLLNKLEVYCSRHHLSRDSVIEHAVRQVLLESTNNMEGE